MNVGNNIYHELIDAWNQRDAATFSALFAEDSICIGFDGSEMNGRELIFSQLSKIFADHQTARYVTIIREIKTVGSDMVLVRAHAGMIQHNKVQIDSSKNVIQVMVAHVGEQSGKILLFQNTPAQFHGRPEAQNELTAELQTASEKIF